MPGLLFFFTFEGYFRYECKQTVHIVQQRVGEKKLASIMKTTKQKAGLETNKRLTNHSVRKYLVQKLKDNNVEDTDIMQISGHKSVQSVRNYSAISEGKHKRISNVLAGADSDNSCAFVPIQTTNSSLDQRITCTFKELT